MKSIGILALAGLAATATALVTPQNSPHPKVTIDHNLALHSRSNTECEAAGDQSGCWGKRDGVAEDIGFQVYARHENVPGNFDAAIARKMATEMKAKGKEVYIQAYGDRKCYIGACEEDIGYYLCSYKPEGVRVTAEVMGNIGLEIMDRWDDGQKRMARSKHSDAGVVAYSFWSKDPTWNVMFAKPCLKIAKSVDDFSDD